MTFISLANVGVRLLSPYLPGKPVEELERELGIKNIIKLASNENPLGSSPRAIDAACNALSQVHLYPDGNGYALKQALAKKFGFSALGITLGNGSNDVLELMVRGFVCEADEVIISQHAFAVYYLASQSVNASIKIIPAKNYGCDLLKMAQAVTSKTKIIFLTNPNNPTGTWFSRADFEQFMSVVPECVLVVLDEAYCEYIDEPTFPCGFDYLSRYQNLIVTRTFSKIYGLSGLRVGYGVSHPDMADILNRVRQPFNVNHLALVAATEALNDEAFLLESKRANQRGMKQIEQGLTKLGLNFIPSLGNFICFNLNKQAMPIYNALLKKGIIVRPVANYELPNFLRVTIGTEKQNEIFLQKLEQVLNDE